MGFKIHNRMKNSTLIMPVLSKMFYFKCLNILKKCLCCNACYLASGRSERIQTVEVVVIAAMVPTGMDFWASRRSPERLEPAMIPDQIVEKETWSGSEVYTHTGTENKLENINELLHIQNVDSEVSGIINDRNV